MTEAAHNLHWQAMSVEEYLRSEATSAVRREYMGGYVYTAQAGASRAHNRICINIITALDGAAQQHACQLYQSDMRLSIEALQSYFYPDVMLVCQPAEGGNKVMQETRPCFIAEVLSGSTASIDRLAKYAAYTQLPSLETYLLVEQNSRKVYVYQRSHQWQAQELAGSGEFYLPCLKLTLNLDQIYRYLDF